MIDMINISNEKLVLWGHIIVLSLIFLVGFGMIFNVISYENTDTFTNITHSEENKTQINNYGTSFNQDFIDDCNNDQNCIKFKIEEFMLLENNPEYCNFLEDKNEKYDCYQSFFESISFELSFNYCESFIYNELIYYCKNQISSIEVMNLDPQGNSSNSCLDELSYQDIDFKEIQKYTFLNNCYDKQLLKKINESTLTNESCNNFFNQTLIQECNIYHSTPQNNCNIFTSSKFRELCEKEIIEIGEGFY